MSNIIDLHDSSKTYGLHEVNLILHMQSWCQDHMGVDSPPRVRGVPPISPLRGGGVMGPGPKAPRVLSGLFLDVLHHRTPEPP